MVRIRVEVKVIGLDLVSGWIVVMRTHKVAQKKLAHFVLYALTSSFIGRFSNLFHYQNQANICNHIVTKMSLQVCRYTTL